MLFFNRYVFYVINNLQFQILSIIYCKISDEGAAVEPDTSAALLSDETTMTPLANESLRSFFARTVGNRWAPQASEEAHRDGRELDEKELRRRAFALAEMNFESLQRRKQSGDE